MKKLLLLISLSLIYIFSFSQEQFNLMHENQFNPNIANIFQVADTGYVSLGGEWYNGKLNIDINYFDTLGGWIWNKHYGNDTYNYFHGAENACIKTDGVYFSRC